MLFTVQLVNLSPHCDQLFVRFTPQLVQHAPSGLLRVQHILIAGVKGECVEAINETLDQSGTSTDTDEVHLGRCQW